jgi:trk system potassium uptake protein TrkA
VKVVVIGAGRSGTGLAARLAKDGHSVTLVDRDERACQRAFEQFGIATLPGDGTDPAILSEAGADRADVLVALLRHDADNLAIALLGREMGAKRVMARMRDNGYARVYRAAGVEEIVSEVDILVSALHIAALHPRVRGSMRLGGGESVAFEVLVPDHAAASGKTVKEVAGDPDFPQGAVFAGVTDAHGTMVGPRGDSMIRPGGSVIVVAPESAIDEVTELLTRR